MAWQPRPLRQNLLASVVVIGVMAAGALVVYLVTHSLVLSSRRVPPPWSVEDIDAAFVVKVRTGPEARLCYVYYEKERDGRRGLPGDRTRTRYLTLELLVGTARDARLIWVWIG